MAEIIMRFAFIKEREMLEALQWRASLANEGDRDALLTNPDAITLPVNQIEAGLVVVAEIDRIHAGFAALIPREDADVELDGLFVEPDRWRHGVGRALVQKCCELGREMNAAFLQVLGNPHACAFYEKCGFEPMTSEATRFGPAIRMRKKI